MYRIALALIALLLVASGCFNPRYPEGIPCSEANTCPPGQQCDLAAGICLAQPRPPLPGDASVPDAPSVASCTDNVQNGNETDTDCGGPDCPACGNGSMCGGPDDCESRTCRDSLCVSELCGDGNRNGEEECDTGGASETCDADCTAPVCGDGLANAAAEEECDDRGESETCDVDCTAAACGDGVRNATADEACDDRGESATCDGDCTAVECGDGVRNATANEACDDGNLSNGDNCTAQCALASCTDQFRNADEIDVDCGGHCGPGSCDLGQVCGGNGDCATGFCDRGTCNAPQARFVFVSSELYTGNMGGLAGADARCQGLANAAGLPGTYRAWLSSSTESPSTRFAQSTAPYMLVDGTVIANNWADLTDGSLDSAIDLTERGTVPPASTVGCPGDPSPAIWSGTAFNGTAAGGSSQRCNDWTTSQSPSQSQWGNYTLFSSGSWSNWCSGGTCEWQTSIYCFQQ